MTSVPPPALNPMISRIGLCGYGCADAAAQIDAPAGTAASHAVNRFPFTAPSPRGSIVDSAFFYPGVASLRCCVPAVPLAPAPHGRAVRVPAAAARRGPASAACPARVRPGPAMR